MKLKDAGKERMIMDAVVDIVHAKGLMGVKMIEVAKKVNISPSNLYIYFKNKEDLLLCTFFDTIKGLVNQFEENLPTQTSYKKRIYAVFQHMVQIKSNKKKEFSYAQQFFQSPYFKKKYFQKVDLISKNLFEVFVEGQRQLILKKDVDIHLIFGLVDGATTQFVECHNKGLITLDQKTLKKSFKMIWDAIRA